MGSDDLFNKRKAKLKSDLQRRKAQNNSFDRVLIVCEGSKTEPQYLCELREYYEIQSANLKIDGECGTDPISVFNHAKTLYEASRRDRGGRAYDRVYCVFDQDSYHLPSHHNKYQQCLDKIRNYKPKNVFRAVPSVPSFEYWLLLHFAYTTQPIYQTGDKSPGKVAEDKLKEYWADYAKGKKGTFARTVKDIETAKVNAIRALGSAAETNTDNPTTYVHELVDYLQKVNKRAK